MWQEALYAAAQVPLSETEIQELGMSLAEDLVFNKHYQEAATVHLDYRNDLEEAVKVLCKGFFYEEAMRIVSKLEAYTVHRPNVFRSDCAPQEAFARW